MSNLTEYAESELALAGIAADDGYDGMIYEAVMEIVKLFTGQGHSGFSANQALGILTKLLAYKPLSPLTYDDSEWIKYNGGVWQNKRQCTIFSDDQGRTWYDIEEVGTPRHPIPSEGGDGACQTHLHTGSVPQCRKCWPAEDGDDNE